MALLQLKFMELGMSSNRGLRVRGSWQLFFCEVTEQRAEQMLKTL
jgi:hypothetical protein